MESHEEMIKDSWRCKLHPVMFDGSMKRWRKIFVLPDRLQRWQKPYGATVENRELGRRRK